MHFLLHSSAIYVQNNNLCKFWNNVFPSSVFVAKFADRRLNLKQIYWMLFGTSLGNPFLLNVVWDYSGETISKNQNMDYSGETIFKKTISGTILGKPFQRTKRWTILGKPFLKINIWDHSWSNFQPHYHTQAPVVRQNLEAFLGIKSSDLGLQSCHLLVVLHNSASVDF